MTTLTKRGRASLPDRLAGREIITIGECMLEIKVVDEEPDSLPAAAELGFAGDALNVAVYAARAGARSSFLTLLGDDPLSDAMVRAWARCGVGVGRVGRVAGALPGIHAIAADERGERSFYYWRRDAPARGLAATAEGGALLDAAAGAGVWYVTGIVLAILPPEDRETLWGAVERHRARGGFLVCEPNLRPILWRERPGGLADARRWTDRMLETADLFLPSAEDMQALYDGVSVDAIAGRMAARGAGPSVLRLGERGCRWIEDGKATDWLLERPAAAVDTTAAGDSFNGTLLAKLVGGASVEEGIRAAMEVAAAVVRRQGAIIPLAAMPGADRRTRAETEARRTP